MIAIVDYGMGNIHSVMKAIAAAGGHPLVTNRPGDLEMCDKIILPGVGAFDDAMTELEKRGLAAAIKEQAAKKKPILGICLGMQVFFQESREASQTKGFGFFEGDVRRFLDIPGIKVPHMGWNQITKNITRAGECPLFAGLTDTTFVYFCHSYYPAPVDSESISAKTEHGIVFASAVWKENVYGVQFHPEKSQQDGLAILKNFITRIR